MSRLFRWSDDLLSEGLRKSAEDFRVLRLEEEPGEYTQAFDDYWAIVHDLFATTVDLTEWDGVALQVLTDKELFLGFRYLMGPPISLDDLKTIADANSLKRQSLRNHPDLVERIVQIVRDAIDRRRFPWVNEKVEATESERNAAALATAALMATRRIETRRRNEAKTDQEMRVDGALSGAGFVKVSTRRIKTLSDAPNPGQFCSESLFGRRKADFIVGLWDRRVMAIECKVSNSATNSVKRLNNDAAAKAKAWYDSFGHDQVVPTAVLSGVYKLHNLQNAQDSKLTLFWAHDLKSLLDWIEGTKS